MVKGSERRTERFTLRMPPTLHAAIKKAAAADKRSPSDWIVLVLEAAIAKQTK